MTEMERNHVKCLKKFDESDIIGFNHPVNFLNIIEKNF